MQTFTDSEGRVYSSTDTGEAPLEDFELPKPVYTNIDFLSALGDAVVMEIMLASDPVIKLIDRKFQVSTSIDTGHEETEKAFLYLVASEQVPSFNQELRESLCGGSTS